MHLSCSLLDEKGNPRVKYVLSRGPFIFIELTLLKSYAFMLSISITRILPYALWLMGDGQITKILLITYQSTAVCFTILN